MARNQYHSKVWVYTPENHKTDFKEVKRFILFPKKCKKILEKEIYQNLPDDEIIFSAKRNQLEKAGSKKRTRGKSLEEITAEPSVEYGRNAFRLAINRAIKKAGIPHFFPYMVRHTTATDIDRKYGKKAAAAVNAA